LLVKLKDFAEPIVRDIFRIAAKPLYDQLARDFLRRHGPPKPLLKIGHKP
jgi:hypothetical protein